ncbi:MAG: hypothetical protein DKINENOH_02298 [bacterium]|nr:hypothetical protein [bacterium]MCK6559336.1 DUF4340 domain-containing protein [bacterium]
MSEKKKTLTFVGVAAGLLVLALITAPRRVTPTAFNDQGQPFFPEFKDPLTATSLEVIDYDEATGSAQPFKVQLKDGKWTIPSHHNYPADGKDRLAKTAAAVIDIKKDDFRSDNVSDHEGCGVVDPLDEKAASLKGRGKRVTIKGAGEQVLADFIIGKPIEGRDGFRFVRVPGQKRVYAARMNIDISTKFSDWIEADLLQVNKDDIQQVVLKDYSIDERRGIVNQRDVIVLDKKESDWLANNMRSSEEVDKTKMNDFLTALDGLAIVGVRLKPAGLSESLEKSSSGVMLSQSDMLSLQSKGYYFTPNGQLLSNEGELQATTKDGVIYTLRFGEVVYGQGEAVTAGSDSLAPPPGSGPAENRYLFITTSFDPKQLPAEPKKPRNTDFASKPDSLWTEADRENKRLQDEYDEWQKKMDKGHNLSNDLNTRFARWYYVISSASFDKLHLTRRDLVKPKTKTS